MANLKGNLGGLVSTKVKDDKRDKVIDNPKTEISIKETRGRKSLKSEGENYVATRLLLPESLKKELDIYCIEENVKGKNELLVEAIRKHLSVLKE